jgi:transposase
VKDKQDNLTSEYFKKLCKGDEELAGYITSLNEVIQHQENTIKQLENRIILLEEKINKDSHNSSKPPSSDGLKKKTKSLRKKSGRKSGGQKGHKGTTLKPVKHPDKTTVLKVDICKCCGKSLKDEEVIMHDTRQVTDIPEIIPQTEEYQAEVKICSGCETENIAIFPPNVINKIQYGKHLRSIIVYLRHQNYIPCERLGELMDDIFGVPLSEGTIVNTSKKCGELLSGFDDWVKDKLLSQYVLHFDESGIRINGKLNWLHSISNSIYTYFYPHEKRGKEAIDEIGILPKFSGVAIHDYWQSYLDYTCSHGLCNAHHLRELTYFHEEMNQKWAGKMIKLLLDLKKEVDMAKEKGKLIDTERMLFYERKYRLILREGFKVNPFQPPKKKKRGRVGKGKVLNFLIRFKTRVKNVLAFMYDINVPFDNNQAERDIRMAKLQQKISGCFRSKEGSTNFFRIKSFISTIRKHRLNVIESIEKVFDNHKFNGIITFG